MSLNACMSEKKQPSRTTTLKRYKSYSTRGEFCASRYRPVYGSTLIQIPNKSKGLERGKKKEGGEKEKNKAGYMATPVACEWAGAVFEVTQSFGQEQ